ncbi:OmpH family outer membrane protein [Oceanibacterium hippocampi]|uniref:Outer membrane protein (OmpH-like) n=1 Tax=Oceanibacterium hippocampi TaxID=745714 RepID=A0A1Y5TW32_9PROT|nr:OmpH family outer membrane protein [Oceanibacterium hippocampi]SLN74771.1 Outer membrane protein (OmpH-like) [Oceanibacterium hippocampi]
MSHHLAERILAAARRVAGAAMLATVMLIAATATAPAKNLPKATVAIVDTERVLRESEAGKSAREQIRAQQEVFQKEFDAQREALKTEKEQLDRQKAILAPDVWQQRVREFRTKAETLQKEAQGRTMTLNQADIQVRQKMMPVITKVVADVSHKQGANIAIDRAALMLFVEELNLTDLVIEKLNEVLPKVDINFDAVPEKTN